MKRQFAAYEVVGSTVCPIATGDIVEVITRLLAECNTAEIDVLQRLHLPKARFDAASDPSRTAPIQDPSARRK